jgi:hypothetical protein
MDQAPDARFSRKPGNLCCGFDVNGMEGLWPTLRVQAHRIRDALDTRDGSGNGAIVIDVGLDRVEVKGGEKRGNAFRMPHRYRTEKSRSSRRWTTRWPRKPVPPKTVTFRGAIVLFLAMLS